MLTADPGNGPTETAAQQAGIARMVLGPSSSKAIFIAIPEPQPPQLTFPGPKIGKSPRSISSSH